MIGYHRMKLGWTTFLLPVLVAVHACAPVPGGPSGIVTPSDLNAAPASYDGKFVRVAGWLDFGFERRNLITTDRKVRVPTVAAVPGDCVGLQALRGLIPKAKRLDGRRVIVDGTFRADLVGPNITFSRCNASGIQVVKINAYGR